MKVANKTGFIEKFPDRQIELENSTVCSYHVTYAFQSESTLYCCLNVKEILARNRGEI